MTSLNRRMRRRHLNQPAAIELDGPYRTGLRAAFFRAVSAVARWLTA